MKGNTGIRGKCIMLFLSNTWSMNMEWWWIRYHVIRWYFRWTGWVGSLLLRVLRACEKKAVLETGVPDLDNFSIFCWKRVYGNVRRGICYYTGGFTATRLQLQTEGVKPAGLSVRSCIWQNGDIQGSCSQGRWDRCSPPRAGSTTPPRFILQPAALGFQGRSSAWLGGVYDKLVRQIHKSLPYMLCTRIL